jgi:rfaE bifunctional protein nucleotidyltransferase chain/domain/rfaE bifunctional protein kinase chain/domain
MSAAAARRLAVTVVGDALLDRDLEGTVERVCPDAPVPVVDAVVERSRLGGAALAALLAAGDGAEVTLVTALGDDDAGDEVRDRLAVAGVVLVDLRLEGPTPQKVRVLAGDRPVVRIDHGGGPAAVGAWSAAAERALESAGAVLVADYGRGTADVARGALEACAKAVPVVWDPHPRGGPAARGARVVTPNQRELLGFVPDDVGGATQIARVAAAARVLGARWGVHAVAVTMGARGALLSQGDGLPLVVPALAVSGHDTCGAGDRFASATAVALARGAVVSEAVEAAVAAAGAFVASGGAGAYATRREDVGRARGDVGRGRGRGAVDVRRPHAVHAVDVVQRVRAEGGVVVATGGCFDLLHAGHIATLHAARALGDCLVVLCNSDASIRRLKGAGRPLQPAADRAAVLAALDCVDAVEVFDTPTPVPALETLRPDIFAKGGDYAIDDLPEAAALARWGGQVVVLPYLAGRSTTRLVEEAQRRGQ